MNGKRKKTQAAQGRIAELTSLGCPKNFVDTEIAAASLVRAGFGLSADGASADVRFINTCAFLKSARDEAARHLRDAEKWKKKKPGRAVVAAGCLCSYAEESVLRAEFPGVDLWLGIDSVEKAGELLSRRLADGKAVSLRKTKNYIYDHTAPRLQLTPPHYAYLKIADGCGNRCAYCLIPSIRGELRSRAETDVLAEAESLLRGGVRELIVIAQDTSAFGRDTDGKPRLASLLEKLDALEGDFLIRLMYLHPAGIDDTLVSVLKRMKRLAPCLEMPIQHIAENVLRAMNRKIFEEETRAVVKKLRDAGFALRTTLLTGFPGETAGDFRKLEQFVRETKFERLGVFAFSPEAGTPAALLPGKVAARTAEHRRDMLLSLQAGLSYERNQSLVGREIEVIVDAAEKKPGLYSGRTLCDAPEIDNIVLIASKKKLANGDRVFCKLEKASEYDLSATFVKQRRKK